MTNGFILSFRNKNDFNDALKKINNMIICGFKLFEIKVLKKNQIFCRVQIKSRKDLSKIKIDFGKIKKNLFYDKDQIIQAKINKIDIFEFVRNISFIKTTSRHVHEGSLFYENLNLKKNKKIENIKIYKIIKNYFL